MELWKAFHSLSHFFHHFFRESSIAPKTEIHFNIIKGLALILATFFLLTDDMTKIRF